MMKLYLLDVEKKLWPMFFGQIQAGSSSFDAGNGVLVVDVWVFLRQGLGIYGAKVKHGGGL